MNSTSTESELASAGHTPQSEPPTQFYRPPKKFIKQDFTDELQISKLSLDDRKTKTVKRSWRPLRNSQREPLKENTNRFRGSDLKPIERNEGDEKPSEVTESFSMKNFKGRPSSCVFVASLPTDKSDDELNTALYECFGQWGEIVMVKVLRDVIRRPYAFVQYTNDADAKKALNESQNASIHGRAVRCEAAKVNRTVYIAASAGEFLSQKEALGILQSYGEIEELTPAIGETKASKTSNDIESESEAWFGLFAYRDDAVRAYVNLRTSYKGVVEWAQNVTYNLSRENATIDRKAIYVGQLDKRVTKCDLWDRFASHGEISSLDLVVKGTHTLAFIRFKNEEAAAAALEKENHSLFFAKTIQVQYRDMNHVSGRDLQPILRLAPPPVIILQSPLVGKPVNKENTDSDGFQTVGRGKLKKLTETTLGSDMAEI